jgi:hypothetical protein
MERPTPDDVEKEIADLFAKKDNPVRVSGGLEFDEQTGKPDGANIQVEIGNDDSNEEPDLDGDQSV